MKYFIALLILVSATACRAAPNLEQMGNSFILNNINIVDVENRQIQFNKSILVNKGKILNIAQSPMPAPSNGITIIDGNGGYVTPGLIDMHVHIFEEAAFALALSHGITHVRIMNGVPDQLKWRDQIEAGELIGSSATVSSPILSAYDANLHHTVHTAKQAEAAVKRYQSEGYDLIKLYGNLSEEALTAAIETGKKLNIPIAKHGPHASGNMPISSLFGLQSLEHVEDIYQGPLNYKFDSTRIPAIAESIKAVSVPVTPTLNIYYQLTKLSVEKEAFLDTVPTEYTSDIIALEASNNQIERWLTASDNMAAHNQKTLSFLQHITNVFHNAGIPLLVGSDSGVLLSPHGLATHNEMRLMHESGMAIYDVLAAATINPAKALKMGDQIGKVSENYKADFILSETSPLDDLSTLKRPEAVVKNGHFYPKKALRKMREKAIESRSIWKELGTLFRGM